MAKRYYKKKRVYKKKAPSNKSLSKEIKVIKNQMMELKFHDVVFPIATITTAGTGAYWTSPCLMAQGDNVETRQANKIYTKSFEIRAMLSSDDDRLSSSNVRMIVFWDNTPNGSNPIIIGTPTALLDDSAATIPGYFAFPNKNTNRYTILADKYFTISPDTVADYDITTGNTDLLSPKTLTIKKYFKCKRVVQYNGILGTITDLSNNGLFVAWICQSSVSAPTVLGSARLMYNDA